MRVLSVDCSTWWGGVALVERPDPAGRSRTVVEIGLQVPSSHAGAILEAADAALALAGWGRGDVDGFVSTRGPGSFTGIRIGLGTVRGLGLAADRPTAGVSTLDALAEAYGPAESERWSLISAGRGEIFGARYPAEGSPCAPVGGPWLFSLDQWPKEIAGERSERVAIPAKGSEQVVRESGLAVPGVRVAAAPESVAAAAGRWAIATGALERTDGDAMTPLYLRQPDAELKSPAP